MSNEAVVLSIMLGMVGKGRSEADAWRELLDQGNRGGRFLQQLHQRNPGRSRRWMTRQYQLRQKFAAAHPATDGQHTSYALVRYAELVQQGNGFAPGMAGVTDRSVLSFLTERAMVHMHPLVRASHRTISEETDVNLTTVGPSLARLVKHGWLEIQEASSGFEPSTYRLLIRDTIRTGDSVPYGVERCCVRTVSLSHHLFGPAGVGREAAETYSLLPVARRRAGSGTLMATNRCVPPEFKDRQALMTAARLLAAAPDDGMSVKELQKAHPGTPHLKTIRRRLKTLERAGLAYCDEECQWWRYVTDVDGVAEYLHVPDTRWEKHARYLRERLAYWDYLLTEAPPGKRPTGLVRYPEGADVVYAIVDDDGCLREVERRAMSSGELIERNDYEEDADEPTGTA